VIIKAQPGPQEEFLSCNADVVFYGGAAGGCKTYSLLLEPLHYAPRVPGFKTVTFRRTYPEITNPGGLWDESETIYPHAGGKAHASGLRWRWKNGSWLKFAHMQHEKDLLSWQGSQIALICFDELTHFSQRMFLYMLSRNRSNCGVRPYIRATMNPDPDSWIKDWIAWYLDDKGQPIPKRSGVIRYFARNKANIEWADKAEDLIILGLKPKSFTFIAASVYDNKILMENNPDYVANLEALLPHEREQLLDGNWNARATAGSFFQRQWVQIIDAMPGQYDDEVTYWDRAASIKTPQNTSPDATVGIHIRRKGEIYYVCDMRQVWETPHGVQRTIVNTAATRKGCTVCLEEDPGQAGKADVATLIAALARYRVEVRRVSTNKANRLKPFSTQAQAGNVKIVKGPWNNAFFLEMEAFTTNDKEYDHDDIPDATSGAYNYLADNATGASRSSF